jgi:diacylglycerol kinase (ATP)
MGSQAPLAIRQAAPTAVDPAPLRLGVLTNRRSTRNRTGTSKVGAMLSRHLDIPHVEIEDFGELPMALGKLARVGVNAIAVNGGDGTVIGILTELRRRSYFARNPELVLLTAGNTNMIAGDVGLTGRPHRALARFLKTASSGGTLERLKRRLIRVEQDGQEPHYCLFIGAVAIVRAVRFAHCILHPMGIRHGFGDAVTMGLGALGVALRRGWSEGLLSGAPIEIGFDGEPSRHEFCAALMATTLEQLLFGSRPFWGTEPGAIHATLVRAPVERPLRSLLPVLRGRPTAHMKQGGYLSRNTDRIRLVLEGRFMIDGEIHHARRDRPIILSDGGTAAFLRG